MSDMLPRPEPRDAFKRALRAQLMAQAPRVLTRKETAWSSLRGSWLKPAVAFAAITLLLVGSAGKAAADSLPGDLGYGLKVAAEQVQLALALDDSSRLRLLSDDADHRLAELSTALTTRPDVAPAATDEYAAAVARFTAAVDAVRTKPDTSADKKTAAEDVVDAAHAKHEAVISELEKTAPAAAQQGLERAKEEADKLHPSGRPAPTPEPNDEPSPDRSRSPQPARTTSPTRTAEPTRSGDDERGGDSERSASPRPSTRP